MKSITFKSSKESIKMSNTNHGEVIESVEDLSPNARLAKMILLTIRNPNEVTTDGSRGEVELF